VSGQAGASLALARNFKELLVYEDLSEKSPAERKTIARERWDSLPAMIKDKFANAPKRAMYQVLQRLGVPAVPKRSVDWSYTTNDGSLIMTIWHDHIQLSPNEALVYYVPISRWRGAGSQGTRADQLQSELTKNVGKTVRALLLHHEWDQNDTQFAKSVAADIRSWYVEQLSVDVFLLWRGRKV
jgi:hypothetical protein